MKGCPTFQIKNLIGLGIFTFFKHFKTGFVDSLSLLKKTAYAG